MSSVVDGVRRWLAFTSDAETRALLMRIAALTEQRELARRWAVAMENEAERNSNTVQRVLALVADHDRLTGYVPTSELIDALDVDIDTEEGAA